MKLKQLGLSDSEEKAYKALVHLGKSSASDVSREGGVSYGKIYEVLASLERKGLVRVVPEKTKKFTATDPTNLMKIVDDKEEQLGVLRTEVKNLKQMYESREEEVVQLVKGVNNFPKVMRNFAKPHKYSYSIKYNSLYKPEVVMRAETEVLKGIDVKSLARYEEDTKRDIKKWLKVVPNIREMKNKGTSIFMNESEVVFTLIKSNIIVSIKDKTLCDLMKNLFDNTYKISEKIKK
ncbi:TrmB family transcriptional regulator [Nanoarchaeota archaeon]